MIYQFEREEIKACVGCPFSLYETDHMEVFVSCNLLKTIVWTNACENKDISPRCPLVAISKTETTSCEWCEKIGKYAQFDFATYTEVDGDNECEYAVKVNYCPNCGRKLN